MRVLLYCDDPGYGGTAVNAGLLAAGLAGEGLEVVLAASADITGGAPGVAYVPIDYDTMRTFAKTAHSRNEPEAIFMAVRPDVVVFCDGAPDSSLAAKTVCRAFGLPYLVHVNYVAPTHPAELGGRLSEVVRANAAALAVVAVSGGESGPAAAGLWRTGRAFGRHPLRPAAGVFSSRPGRRPGPSGGPGSALVPKTSCASPWPATSRARGIAICFRPPPCWPGIRPGRRLFYAAIGHSIGDGQKLMEAMVAEAGLSGRVALLGRRDDVREWLGAADIFALPSESEGMPLCITEAMGQGLPVVASAVSGIPEQLGAAGILLPDPALDPEATALALATALAGLAREPAARQILGQAGRERARSRFTAPAMIRSWLDLLASLAPALAAAQARYPDPAGYLPPNAAPFGRDIPIGDDLAAAEFLKEGWSHGEGEGRWTEGGRAGLALGLPEAARDGFVLEFHGRPFLGRGDAPLALTVTVCGREAGRFAWPGSPQPLAAALACLPGTGRFAQQAIITLAIDGASSPASHAISDDPRQLGFFLAGLRLSPFSRPSGRP